MPPEVYADAFVEINGYSVTLDRFHILFARAKRPSLLNYKKFRVLILQILSRYKTITATSATRADHVIGMGDSSDWRFETHKGSNRLRVYWSTIGFGPLRNHKHQVYISNSKDLLL
jgi:hypothetical protein